MKRNYVVVFLYLILVPISNLLVKEFGLVNFYFLTFPAGAITVGLSFTLRDIVQERYGKKISYLWMIVGCGLTYLFSEDLAVISSLVFMVSETIDWFIFSISSIPFKQKIIFSNIVSIPIDSFLFVYLAFGLDSKIILSQSLVKFVFSLIFLCVRKKR